MITAQSIPSFLYTTLAGAEILWFESTIQVLYRPMLNHRAWNTQVKQARTNRYEGVVMTSKTPEILTNETLRFQRTRSHSSKSDEHAETRSFC